MWKLICDLDLSMSINGLDFETVPTQWFGPFERGLRRLTSNSTLAEGKLERLDDGQDGTVTGKPSAGWCGSQHAELA